jgi:hypothetical protein
VAVLTITVPDSVVPRIRTAFGHSVGGVWTDATVVEVQDATKVWIKQRVIEYESAQVAMQKRSDVSGEVW